MKRLLIITSLVLALFTSATSAFATEVSRSSTGHTFDQNWTSYATGSNWIMEYGFNSSWIDEDFTHTKHNTTSHIAKVSNGKGTFTDNDSAGWWAEIEVQHVGTAITYTILF